MPHKRLPTSRRDFLMNAGSGLGALALSAMMADDGLISRASAETTPPDPLRPKAPHFKPTAKSVIWLFMEGGPSHVDSVRSEAHAGKIGRSSIAGFVRKSVDCHGHQQQHADAL